jgi:hypothetical protein
VVRQLRAEHTEQLALSDRLVLEYGAEYLMAGGQETTTTLRPGGRVIMRVSPKWIAAFSVETEPGTYALHNRDAALQSALDSMDSLPQRVWRNGQATAIAGGWHHEFAARRDIGSHANVELAVFRDLSRHDGVFGYDSLSQCDPSSGPCTSRIYAHDVGRDASWGTRVVYHYRLAGNLDMAAVYAWAGALALENGPAQADLDARIRTRFVHSAAARVSGKVPKLSTQVSASYKWLSTPIVNRQDLYGEAAQGIDPNLSFSVRQPLPPFLNSGHWEALVDFRNVLAQGYINMDRPDGRTIFVPVMRSFRGGLSFQF